MLPGCLEQCSHLEGQVHDIFLAAVYVTASQCWQANDIKTHLAKYTESNRLRELGGPVSAKFCAF